MRDYALGTTFDVKFTTRRFSTGAPFTLAGTPSIAAYPDNSTTEITAGITLTVDFDARTGLNNVRVVATSGNGYAAGSNYALVITAGTVDSVSVVGEVVGEFSIEAQSPLRPTTAGRTLDVTAGGNAGVDWANVETPGSTVNLSATTINLTNTLTTYTGNTPQTGDAYAVVNSGTHGNAALKTLIDAVDNFVDTEIADIQARLPAALVGGRMDGSVGAMAANVMTAAATAADYVTELQAGLSTLTQAQVQTECEEALQTYHLDHLIASADPGSVVADSSFLAKLVSKSATPSFASYVNTTDSMEAQRDNVGTAGAGLTAVPWNASWDAEVQSEVEDGLNNLGYTTTVSGRIDAAISSRLASASYTAPLDAAGTRSALGLASANLDTQLAAIDDYIDTEIAAIQTNLSTLFTTALTEAYRTDGATGSVAQLLYELLSHHAESSISGTTKTTKKIDGSTTATTLTLNSSTTPTSITRAA